MQQWFWLFILWHDPQWNAIENGMKTMVYSKFPIQEEIIYLFSLLVVITILFLVVILSLNMCMRFGGFVVGSMFKSEWGKIAYKKYLSYPSTLSPGSLQLYYYISLFILSFLSLIPFHGVCLMEWIEFFLLMY